MKHIEKIANLAIIAAVAVFLAVVARNNLLRPPAAAPTQAGAQIGPVISLPGFVFLRARILSCWESQ